MLNVESVVNAMQNIVVHAAVLLDILYSVSTAELKLRNVVPFQALNNLEKSNKLASPQPVFNNGFSKHKSHVDYADLFDPKISTPSYHSFDFGSAGYVTKLEPKLSPQLVDWLNMYDLGQDRKQPLLEEQKDTVSSSTWYPVLQGMTTTTVPPPVTIDDPAKNTNAPAQNDEIALKCAKWATCRVKVWDVPAL